MSIALALLLAAQPVPAPAPAEAPVDAPIDWDKEFGVEQAERDPVTGELPVKPYRQDNANAGAQPFAGPGMAETFGGKEGIRRLTDRLVTLSEADPRIAEIFKGHDTVRLRRTLFEQFCHILGASCDYTGRDMAAAHKGMGLRMADLNALVENLQQAMREQGIPFAAQNRFLSRLAPMDRAVLER